MKQDQEKQKGAGIIEMLISSTVLLLLFQFFLQSFVNFQKVQKYENMQLSNLFLKNYLNESVDCKETVNNAPDCNSNKTYLKLYSKSPGPDEDYELVAIPLENKSSIGKEYTKIANYQIRASCSVKDNSINLEARLLSKGNKPIKMPLQKKNGANKKNLWVSIYDKIDFPCVLKDEDD